MTTRRGQRYPGQRFQAWRHQAAQELVLELLACAGGRDRNLYPLYCITRQLILTVRYWPGDARRRDVPGMLDALCHLLEYAEIVEDDAQITEVHWQELPIDYGRPRVEITIQAIGGG